MRRNVCGTAQVRPHAQSGANRSGAVALVPHTLGVALGRRREDIALSAAVVGARAASCSTSQSGRFSHRSDVSLFVPRR